MAQLKIKSSHNNQFRNSEHFQFVTEVKDLLTQYRSILNGTTLAAQFTACYAGEDEALKKIVKNAATATIAEADHTRDVTFRGLADTVQAAVNHYKPAVAAAAKRLKIVFDTYGNLSAKPLNEETADIYNLLQELTGKYAPDVELLGLTAWAKKLSDDNLAFKNLVKERNNEVSAATQLKMKTCRAATDLVYYVIVERINALIIVNGEEAYREFVNKLNTFIDKYANTIAQRQGRSKSKEEEEETATEA